MPGREKQEAGVSVCSGLLGRKSGLLAMAYRDGYHGPPKGNLSNPNKWRVINLMDGCSKLCSYMLNKQLYSLLDEHGIRTRFGVTPNVGCQDGSFTLKSLLHLRHQHNLPTCVAFVDLVKAYDTTNH